MTNDFANHAIEVQDLISIRSIRSKPWLMICVRVSSVCDNCYAIRFLWTLIHHWWQSIPLTGSAMFLVILLILCLAGPIIKFMIDGLHASLLHVHDCNLCSPSIGRVPWVFVGHLPDWCSWCASKLKPPMTGNFANHVMQSNLWPLHIKSMMSAMRTDCWIQRTGPS